MNGWERPKSLPSASRKRGRFEVDVDVEADAHRTKYQSLHICKFDCLNYSIVSVICNLELDTLRSLIAIPTTFEMDYEPFFVAARKTSITQDVLVLNFIHGASLVGCMRYVRVEGQ